MTSPQRTAEWFAARNGKVTGSVVGAILGLSPYMTRADVLRAMVRAALGEPTEFTGNVATQWGAAMESEAKYDYQMDTYTTVTDIGFVVHPDLDWLGASPDGFVAGTQGLVEFKCPYGLRNDPHPVFKTLADQPHYAAQVQIEMACTGKLWCDFYQWTPHGSSLERVLPDPEWLAAHIPILKAFHDEYAAELKNNAADYTAPRRAEVDTPDALALLCEYDELAEQIELATERKKELLSAIVTQAGGVNALVCGRKLTLVQKDGAVSYAKAIKALVPDADLSPWKGKPSSFWKLS